MKIEIHSGMDVKETEITVRCGQLTPEIEKIISMLRMLELQITGKKDGETHLLDAGKILYIDTADKKTFLYTQDCVYETELHLYELEEQLEESGFFRAGKSCIINLRHIVSLKADIDRRIRVTLCNGEQLMISRQYADGIKRKLGVK